MNELPAVLRYDVMFAEEIYAENVDRRLVMDAIQEILVGGEKMGRNIHAVRIIPHTPRHSTGAADGGASRPTLVAVPGGTSRATVESIELPSESGKGHLAFKTKNWDGEEVTVSYPLNSGKVDDATQADYLNPLIDDDVDMDMIGECCGDTAGSHSLIFPYPCTAMGCNCQKWNSGE